MTLPEVSDEAAFRAALQPHIERMRLAVLFMRMDVTWSGGEARQFAELLARLCTWNDQDAVLQVRAARRRLLEETGVTISSEIIGEQEPDIFSTEMAPIIDLLRDCMRPGLQARWPADAVPTLLASVELMLERAYLRVPLHILDLEEMVEDLTSSPSAP